MFGMEAQGAALAREALRETQATNAARLSFSCHHQASSGVGHFTIEAPIDFDMPFLTQPFFVQGAAVKIAPDRKIWGIPQGSASVWQWKRNIKGHYLGAYLGLSVSIETLDGGFYATPPGVEMIHDLIFIGVGYKDLGPGVSVQAQILTPRVVGFGEAS